MYNSEVLLKIFSELFEIKNNTLEISKDEIIDWDSFNHIKLIQLIEKKFNVTIPIKDIPKLYSNFQIIESYLTTLIS